MVKSIMAAAAILFSLGTAYAQSTHVNMTTSDVDVKSSRHGSPGTVGAMDAVARSVATSAEDVFLQQRGRSTLASGGRPLTDRTGVEAAGYSPGTVGATPGEMPVH